MSIFSASLEELAKNLAKGRGLFFIGSGFSLASEPNFPNTILARLIARLKALTTQLGHSQIYDNFKETFRLDDYRITSIDEKWITRNVSRYYEVNDWICSAYDTLLEIYVQQQKKSQIAANFFTDVKNDESSFLMNLKGNPLPSTPLNDNLLRAYLSLGQRYRGKAMFLDTVGFADPTIMTGDAITPITFKEVSGKYGSVLKPRHFILARLAQEGLCPLLITTNYDLLLEGGYRLSGLKPSPTPASTPAPAEHLYDSFRVVGDPNTFFSDGHGHRTAMIVKIHGCAHHYRTLREKVVGRSRPSNNDKKHFCRYLDDVVYTYREIQNWRDDDWARDFVRTQVRTRTMAFAGYSGMDPVIHDTFRSVYEEMHRQHLPTPIKPPPRPDNTPCYYFDITNKQSFHGLELLRAASRAHNVPDNDIELKDHPNYVRFHIYPPTSLDSNFPNLDEILAWIFHRTFRLRQRELLHAHLTTVASLLLGHPLADSWRRNILQHFDKLMSAECSRSVVWSNDTPSRDALHHTTLWSERFQRLLLREFHLAQQCAAKGSSPIPNEDRFEHRYEPLIDHPLHAAWGVVVEIALRRMIAHWRGQHHRWTNNDYWWHPTAHRDPPYPGLKISHNLNNAAPTLLLIVPQGVRIAGLQTLLRQHAIGRYLLWSLPCNTPFWPTVNTTPAYSTGQRSLEVPSAEDLLIWAGESYPNKHSKSKRFLP